jgi:hypothetical protein
MAVARSAVVWIGCLAWTSSSLCLGAERQYVPEASIASGIQDEQASFDIPPQSLVTALRAYSEITGVAVLVDDALTAGRHTQGVHGRLKVADALQQLLIGTGLITRYASRDAFTLTLDEHAANDAMATPPGTVSAEEARVAALSDHYASGLQSRIEAALCRSERTRPGRYRLAMQIWIAASGTVERTQLLDTLGTEALDAEITAVMNGLRLDPPPPSMPQPVTLLLLPRPLETPFVCPAEPIVEHG